MKTNSPDITKAERLIKDAQNHLTAYIFRQIAEAGNEYKLAEKTGIPRTTIQTTLREGGILALRKLAYRLAEVKRKKS
jgi:DNA-binding phage protein